MITKDLHIACAKCGAVSTASAANDSSIEIDRLRIDVGQKEGFSFCIDGDKFVDLCPACAGEV